MPRPTVSDKRAAFREMHHAGCFLLPNPWDAGSARLLERLGYRALATTSAGYAWSQGQADGQLSRDDTLAHMRYMAAMSDLPINADFESGFGATPEAVFDSVSLALATGVAGLSIEDSTGVPAQPVRDKAQAVERLLAYSQAGADCLYAPGLRTREEIQTVVQAIAPKPVNVLIGWNSELTVEALAELGVRRISVGGALARAAWGGFIDAARRMIEQGRFDGFGGTPSGAELNELLRRAEPR
jgi:2-methylisocitrate lyase-like PEP mutase family enzyme